MDSDQQLSQQFKKNQTFYFHMDCLNFYTGICAQLSGWNDHLGIIWHQGHSPFVENLNDGYR